MLIKKFKISSSGYIGLGLMVLGTFGDNIIKIDSRIVEFGSFALVIIGFALAYDGVKRVKS